MSIRKYVSTAQVVAVDGKNHVQPLFEVDTGYLIEFQLKIESAAFLRYATTNGGMSQKRAVHDRIAMHQVMRGWWVRDFERR